MKIATWNLERVLPTQCRASAIRSHLDTVAADIWVLTETADGIEPTGCGTVLSGTPDRESSPEERWVGICSPHPIAPLMEFVSDPARCAAASVSLPQGEVIVFGCVLPWNGSTWRGLTSKAGVAFEGAISLYSDDWRRLGAAFPDALLVLGGDFNQSLVDFHYYGSKRQRVLLEDALESCGLVACTGGPQDPVARESSPCACIDHVCVSDLPDVRVVGTARWPDTPRPDRRVSDHFGISVELGS